MQSRRGKVADSEELARILRNVTWMITGGAGYIGAHIVSAMRAAGEDVVVIDDLSTGNARRIPGAELLVGSVLDADFLRTALRGRDIQGVVHLAGKKQVDESVRRPLDYYHENVEGLRVLLGAVVEAGVQFFVFSSSASVYGAPDVPVVTEDVPLRPLNPYGNTKLAGERMVEDVAGASGLRYVSLRYFNVAGAVDPCLADRGTANLVPMVFQRLANRQAPMVFGDDYDTPDGTCIRDFVHVGDVASAHVVAARALESGKVHGLTANVGRGSGVSVLDMVGIIRRVTGSAGQAWAEPEVLPRRPGDPPCVVASADRIRDVLGWQSQFDVEEMVASAWAGWSAAAA